MIAYVEGRLLEIGESAVVVVTDGGVGYEMDIPSHTRQALPGVGERVAFHTYLIVREDMLRLCGFATAEEKRTFTILITIPKIGPKLALSVLSVYRPADLRRIVAQGDAKPLSVVPGVGKRTAEALLHELSYRVGLDGEAALGQPGASQGGVARKIMDGLRGLGYTEGECGQIVQALIREKPDIDVEGGLRAALKQLAKSRG